MLSRPSDHSTTRVERFTRLFKELGVPEPERRAREAVDARCILDEEAIEFVFPPAEENEPLAGGAMDFEAGGDAQGPKRRDVFRLSAYLEPHRHDVREFEIDRNCSMQDLRDKLAEVLELSPYVTSILISQDGLLLATTYSLRDGGRLAVEITSQLRDVETEPVEVTNVGNVEYLDSEAYSHYNEHIRGVLLQLANECPRWRRIRGDGNCFYRAYIVGIFEHAFALLKEERATFLQQLESKLCASLFMTTRDVASLQKVFKLLRKESTSTKLLDMMNRDIVDCDALLVWACRCAIAEYIFRNQDTSMDGEIVVKDIIKANFDQSVEDFCKHVVLAMGKEAEDLILPVAPRALGVPLVVCMVHSDKHVQLQQLRYHPSAEAQAVGEEESMHAVYVLFRPGHYDLLYSKKQAALPLKSVDDYLASSSLREPTRTGASSSGDRSHLDVVRKSQLRAALELMLSTERTALHRDLCNLLQHVQTSPASFAAFQSLDDVLPSYAAVRYPLYNLSQLGEFPEIRAIHDLIQQAREGAGDSGSGSEDAAVQKQLQQQVTACLAEIERICPDLKRPATGARKEKPSATNALASADVAASAASGSSAPRSSQETAEPSNDDIRMFYQSCDQATRSALLDDLHQLEVEIGFPVSLSSKRVAEVFPRTSALDRSVWTEIQASVVVKYIIAQLVNLREVAMNSSSRSRPVQALRAFVNKLVDEFEHPSSDGAQSGANLVRSSSGRRLQQQDSLLLPTALKPVTVPNVLWRLDPPYAASSVSSMRVKILLYSDTEGVATVRLTQMVSLPRRINYYVELEYDDRDLRIDSIQAALNSSEQADSLELLKTSAARTSARLLPALCSSAISSENELRLTIRGAQLTSGAALNLFGVRLVPRDSR